MDLDPRRLRILRAVALRGGVTDAARLLNLTPSAVSQQLTQLESEVGISLIDRSQRRISLTAAGETLATRAERIEQELAEAKHELLSLSNQLSGSVTIIGFQTVIRYLLLPCFRTLAKSHPNLHPHIVEEVDEAKALRELRTGGADIVITEREDHHPEPHYPNLVIHSLGDDDYRIVIPTSWNISTVSMRDLIAMPWVIGPPESACGQALERLSQKYRFTPKHDHVCNEFPTMLSLVAAGLGTAILPSLALSGIDPEMVSITTIPTYCSRRLNAVCRAPKFGPEPVALAVTTLIEDVAKEIGFLR